MQIVNESFISPFKPVNKDFLNYDENTLVYKIKHINNDKMAEFKRKSIKYDCYQQSFLISELLNNGYSINIAKIYKKGNYVLFKIKQIKKNDIVLYDEKDNEYNEVQSLKSKRRCIDNFTNSKMIQLLESVNYKFKIKKIRKQNKILLVNNEGMKRIKTLKINGTTILKCDILRIGEIVHDIIYKNVLKHDYYFERSLF